MKKRLEVNVEFCLYVRRIRHVNSRCKGIESFVQEDFYSLFEFSGNKGRGTLFASDLFFVVGLGQSNF
jgi:hypothetical protein